MLIQAIETTYRGAPPRFKNGFRIDSQTASDFELAWNVAGSIVQWRPARRAA